jgi:hypothetical protein
MSTFKKWLLLAIVLIALAHTFSGGVADLLGGQLVISSAHGWNEGLIYMLLAIVVAIAVK